MRTPAPRLAAAVGRRQDRLLAKADAAAAAVDRAVLAAWDALLAAAEGPPHAVGPAARAALRRLFLTAGPVAESLADAVADASAGAREDVAEHLPERHRAELARRRGRPVAEDAPAQMLAFDPLDWLLPGPTPDEVSRIVFARGWPGHMARLTKLADPDSLASILAASLGAGDTPKQAAAKIRPAVQGYAVSARRVARTEGLRVAHDAMLRAYDGLGDLVAGYKIHAIKDSRTRPEHRRRDGTVYWREPKPGQLGFAQMPRPPLEADGTPAFNCRCFLTPVLAEVG